MPKSKPKEKDKNLEYKGKCFMDHSMYILDQTEYIMF